MSKLPVPTLQSSSPRPWRCFFTKSLNMTFEGVFSTSVEVFLLM